MRCVILKNGYDTDSVGEMCNIPDACLMEVVEITLLQTSEINLSRYETQ